MEKISFEPELEIQDEDRRQRERLIKKKRKEALEDRLIAKKFNGYVSTCVICSSSFTSKEKGVNVCQKHSSL
jgi:hypothetical protein